MINFFGKLFDSNEKQLKRLQPLVDQINDLESAYEKLSDNKLRSKTDEFKGRFQKGSLLDDLLVEAFAAVREAAKRTINQRHYDVQLMGGIVLHEGKIAEMKTGEGKTLAATLPLYLNSLGEKGCHLVTVNDYLARRDSHWMGPIFDALGISVACIYGQTLDNPSPSFQYDPSYRSGGSGWDRLRPVSRHQAYEADVTYGTNNEFGFDYLRDNMVIDFTRCAQRSQNYAIVDEIDNLLIDEARTPLIISGMRDESLEEYRIFARIAQQLKHTRDYMMNEKGRSVDEITEIGYDSAEKMLYRAGVLKSGSLYEDKNSSLLHYLRNAITAKEAYRRDREYVVKDGQVIIVDEFTGRLMFGRRYASGLHQAIEAKENVKVQRESMTFATITFQNYFRMYDKLAGMTGTALTEAEEFHKIYNLEVVVIPTNRPLIREAWPEQIYKTEKAKFQALVKEVCEVHKEGRPILIGTVSIEKSEYLSNLLRKQGISHEVLNAKYHEREANIIAQAGRPGAVTVATNMAGRGVDIVLGGIEIHDITNNNWLNDHNTVVELGGLHIIGSEHHEARRIDNQLRGRSGRQGDPGSSRFFVSLEDDIVRRFGGQRIKSIMDWAGIDENVPIENRLVSRAIENSQVKVEGYHFDIRKHLVEYDDVINRHREVIYNERQKILRSDDLRANILSIVKDEIHGIISEYISNGNQDADFSGLVSSISGVLPLPSDINDTSLSQLKIEEIETKLLELAESRYDDREKELGRESMRVMERMVMLRIIDSLWIEHLTRMEHMRQGIGFQSLRQMRPVDAYRIEGQASFQNLLDTIRKDLVTTIYHVGIVKRERSEQSPTVTQTTQKDRKPSNRVKVSNRKVGRNDPCPCGSGKKYKYCCGR